MHIEDSDNESPDKWEGTGSLGNPEWMDLAAKNYEKLSDGELKQARKQQVDNCYSNPRSEAELVRLSLINSAIEGRRK